MIFWLISLPLYPIGQYKGSGVPIFQMISLTFWLLTDQFPLIPLVSTEGVGREFSTAQFDIWTAYWWVCLCPTVVSCIKDEVNSFVVCLWISTRYKVVQYLCRPLMKIVGFEEYYKEKQGWWHVTKMLKTSDWRAFCLSVFYGKIGVVCNCDIDGINHTTLTKYNLDLHFKMCHMCIACVRHV